MRIPIRISPFFWLTAAIIGFLNSRSIWGTVIWIVAIFVSILVHEFGHATAARLFGGQPHIELIAFGGLTYPGGPQLSKPKEFIVVLMGPLFGFALFLLATLLLRSSAIASNTYLLYGVRVFQLINLFWTILNLIPVMPLDGGQMMRIIFEGLFKQNGMRYAIGASILIGLAAGVYFFTTRFLFVGILFFILAFQNIMLFRSLRHYRPVDQDNGLQAALEKGEAALEAGDEETALAIFEKLHKEAGDGMIQMAATQYLAQLYYRKGKTKEAYELLLALRPHLTAEATLLLHHLAYQQGDFPLVVELSADTFQIEPCVDVALHNAQACAAEAHTAAAIGWLKASVKQGLQDVKKIVEDPLFDRIRSDETFQKFLSST